MMFYDANYLCYVIVITWAQMICQIYMPKPEGHRPKGAGIYIRQISSTHVISNIYHFQHSKNLPKSEGNCSTGFIVTDANFNGGKLF